MTTVNSTSNAAQDVLASLSGTRTAKTATEDMKDRFLTLFVTQLKNQDPLNPLDNAQVTSQLAQINTVQGIEGLNNTLNRLLGFYEDGQAMQAAAMIGKNVLTAGDSMTLGEGGAVGGIGLASPADAVRVSIRDGNGLLVRTLDLGPQSAGDMGFTWDGRTDAAATAAPGRYTFTVEATQGGNGVDATELKFGTVSAVVRANGGFQLDLGDAGQIDFEAVRRIL